MKKRSIAIFRNILILYLILCGLIKPVFASHSDRPNNKFGIHVATPSKEDLENAAKLSNSSGGNWGYVTLVIQENDRSQEKWQEAFDRMRELRLIPIIRIGTQPIADYWRKPDSKDVREWAVFLDSLRWVVKERYIVLFNEPNHGREWGGAADPEDYARVSHTFAKALKGRNRDFFIMLAGFDAAAPSQGPNYEDEELYLRRVFQEKPELKDLIDGWVSHSYPNPGFQGSPLAVGRNSIRSYQWELSLLKELGVKKDPPVFITETGWIHGAIAPVTVGDYLQQAFWIWAQDPRVDAVTPFILNYQSSPFLSFSWQKPNSNDFYEHYYTVQDIPKINGNPPQDQKGTVKIELPHDLLVHSTYHFQIPLVNEGQAVWDKEDGYELRVAGDELNITQHFFADVNTVRPGERSEVDLFLKTGNKTGKQTVNIGLYKNDEKILNGGDWSFQILPLPQLTFEVGLFPRLRAKKDRKFEIQVFDEKEQLVFKKAGLRRSEGRGEIGYVRNIYLGGTYRVVILSQYYLPRQTFVRFQRGQNIAKFEPMLPLDWNVDGAFTWKDLWALLKNPRLLGLFLP